MHSDRVGSVDFPTLGDLVDAWIEQHCRIPDGYKRKRPFVEYDWQFWCTANHYRVREDAVCDPDDPPMGGRHPSPLVQVLATSQDQVDNIWRPLTAMIRFTGAPLGRLLLPREEFIRVVGENEDDPDLDRIDAVTAAASSRLGNPISGFIQDETGIYTTRNGMVETAETQRRGAAGMNGRGFTTTNPWDPSEHSTAQQAWEADMPDVFTFYSPPPAELSFMDKRQRRRIIEHNYAGVSHINVDAIMAECDELMLTNPRAAERFFGNRIVQTGSSWIPADAWEKAWAGAVA